MSGQTQPEQDERDTQGSPERSPLDWFGVLLAVMILGAAVAGVLTEGRHGAWVGQGSHRAVVWVGERVGWERSDPCEEPGGIAAEAEVLAESRARDVMAVGGWGVAGPELVARADMARRYWATTVDMFPECFDDQTRVRAATWLRVLD